MMYTVSDPDVSLISCNVPVPYAPQYQCHNGNITTLLVTFNFFITLLTVCRLSLQDNNDNYEPEYNNVQSSSVQCCLDKVVTEGGGVASLA